MLFLLCGEPLDCNSYDSTNHGVAIVKNLGRRNPQNGNAALAKPAIPSGIPRWTITKIMRFPINFDDQTLHDRRSPRHTDPPDAAGET
ncbi:hypothetical protein ASE69_09505 [Sphingomonas sp. Leaf208]|jgi:hypothetical protein|nr:hypothetical protein ASE69_09505 [Sphingomonas sp. Leaf208]